MLNKSEINSIGVPEVDANNLRIVHFLPQNRGSKVGPLARPGGWFGRSFRSYCNQILSWVEPIQAVLTAVIGSRRGDQSKNAIASRVEPSPHCLNKDSGHDSV